MAYVHSPRTVTDGLVFFYDTGNTLKSYRGEPTTNLATDTPSQGGWPGSYTLIESSTKTFELTTSSIPWGGTDAWTTFYYDVSEYTGQYITISAVFEYPLPSATGGTFNFMMIGQTVNTQTYLGYSGESDRNLKSTATRETVSWSGVIGDGGKVGIMIWMSATAPAELTVRFSNIQVEAKPHATPFVNGTRSATQGLLDLTGNSTIDLTNVSFDSNAQMTFDGTDDTLEIPDTTVEDLTGDFTIENLVYLDSAENGSAAMIVSKRDSSDYTSPYHIYYEDRNNENSFRFAIGGGSSNYTSTNSSNLNESVNTYSHVVSVVRGLTTEIYVNGELKGSNTFTGTRQTNTRPARIGGPYAYNSSNYLLTGEVPITKIYNRALTADEVQRNFNAVKSRFNIA